MNVVWSIAGSDSGGGAGIQADLKTFNAFGTFGCTVITALTAQNTQGVSDIQMTPLQNILAQIKALKDDIPPSAIKLGMLYSPEIISAIAPHLSQINCPIVADPVMVATSGAHLFSDQFADAYKKYIFPVAALITPNIHEAQALTGITIKTYQDMLTAGEALLSLGAQAVLIKGGDYADTTLSSDLFIDANQRFWINQKRLPAGDTHGTGCTLSSAIAANLAQGWPLLDSMIIAKAYVHAGLAQTLNIGHGAHPLNHPKLTALKKHFPWVTDTPSPLAASFKKIPQQMGRYPIVDNISDLTELCSKGIQYIQLRVKQPGNDFNQLCENAQKIAEDYSVQLIINDDAQIGSHSQTGVHLGQEDLANSDMSSIDKKRLVGISTHNLFEMAKGYAHHPSYLAIGPIFNTQSKQLTYPTIGLEKLAFIASICPLPLVAIGGIQYEQFSHIIQAGCSGVAFIQAAQSLLHDGRYDRHFSLPHFTPYTQKKLLRSTIVCVGAGGLAAGFLPYLAAAGVGNITVIDNDLVSYSNLQRQVLYKESDIGQPKAMIAAKFLQALNRSIQVTAICDRLTIDNAPDYLADCDLIIDGTDNYEAHYLINDIARYLKTDLIAASVYQDQGQLFYLGSHDACYRCAFPDAPPITERKNCNTAGVLGTTPATLGIMQAQHAIKILSTDIKPSYSFCRTVNMADWKIKEFAISLAKDCDCCQNNLTLSALKDTHMTTQVEKITCKELKTLLDSGEQINLLDVREDHEREAFNIGGLHIPIQELPERLYELDPKIPYVVYCRSGNRSNMACEFLMSQEFDVKNLDGGMLAWEAL